MVNFDHFLGSTHLFFFISPIIADRGGMRAAAPQNSSVPFAVRAFPTLAGVKLPGCIPPPESPPAPQSPAQTLPAPEYAWAYSTAGGSAESPGPIESARPARSRAECAPCAPATLRARAVPGAEPAARLPIRVPPRVRRRPARLKRRRRLRHPRQSQIRAKYCADTAPRRSPPRQSSASTGPASRGNGNRPQTHLPPCSACAPAPAPHGCMAAAPPQTVAGTSPASPRKPHCRPAHGLPDNPSHRSPAHQRNVALAAVHFALVGNHAELAVLRLNAALPGAHNVALVPQPVADQLRHRKNQQPVLPAERDQVRNPRHLPVVAHDLADHARRIQPRQPRQIH